MRNNELQFDMEDVYKNIERTLGGMIEIKKNEWERKDSSAFLSEDGVIKIMSIIKVHLNKNITLSDLTIQFVRRKRISIFCALYKNLHKNKKEYGIKDTASITIVLQCVDSAIYASMRHAIDGLTSRRFYASLEQKYNMGDRSPPQSGMSGL